MAGRIWKKILITIWKGLEQHEREKKKKGEPSRKWEKLENQWGDRWCDRHLKQPKRKKSGKASKKG